MRHPEIPSHEGIPPASCNHGPTLWIPGTRGDRQNRCCRPWAASKGARYRAHNLIFQWQSTILIVVRCELNLGQACTNPATHMVSIAFPGMPVESWQVCRTHDRELKNLAVADRLPLPPEPDTDPKPTVKCSQCGYAFGDLFSGEPENRIPCPDCGSTARTVYVSVTETISIHESIGLRVTRPGKGGWLKYVKSGDDYTRVLESWGERTLELDREHNLYREFIKLHDGTTIESTARLSDHQG